jgi:prophage antirepressor-like protein
LTVISPFAREHKNRWFCSEAIAAALEMTDPASLSPQDLDDLLAKGAK